MHAWPQVSHAWAKGCSRLASDAASELSDLPRQSSRGCSCCASRGTAYRIFLAGRPLLGWVAPAPPAVRGLVGGGGVPGCCGGRRCGRPPGNDSVKQFWKSRATQAWQKSALSPCRTNHLSSDAGIRCLLGLDIRNCRSCLYVLSSCPVSNRSARRALLRPGCPSPSRRAPSACRSRTWPRRSSPASPEAVNRAQHRIASTNQHRIASIGLASDKHGHYAGHSTQSLLGWLFLRLWWYRADIRLYVCNCMRNRPK